MYSEEMSVVGAVCTVTSEVNDCRSRSVDPKRAKDESPMREKAGGKKAEVGE